MTFKEFLEQKEIEKFYIELDNDIKLLNRIYITEKSLKTRFGFIDISEAVIEPALIKIKSQLTDIKALNDEFNKEKIFFEEDNNLHGYYKQEQDEIHIFIPRRCTKQEVEAMIGHELIHREQNKRSSNKYFEQSKKLVDLINKAITTYNVNPTKENRDKYNELLKKFQTDNSYEKMAYAYQMVKEYPDYSPSKIIDALKLFGLEIDAKMKKYVGMYYLIKDKI